MKAGRDPSADVTMSGIFPAMRDTDATRMGVPLLGSMLFFFFFNSTQLLNVHVNTINSDFVLLDYIILSAVIFSAALL